MPLVVITGIPSSGKSKTCQRLSEFLTKEKDKVVKIVSENDFVDSSKNQIFSDSQQEKITRGNLKSEVQQVSKFSHQETKFNSVLVSGRKITTSEGGCHPGWVKLHKGLSL